MARNGNIDVVPSDHGIGIGIRPSMKDRICANSEGVYGTNPVSGIGKRIFKIKLPFFQLSILRRCANAEFETVQTVSAGTLPGVGDRELSKCALNDRTRGRRWIWQQMGEVPINKAVHLSSIGGINVGSVFECMR